MVKNKMLGVVLLVVGTSIGGGMLALPAVTANNGFIFSSLLLVGIWLLMTFGALLMAEVNLWLHKDNNIISMAKHTLGKPGQIVAWITYLALLYSLVAAYMAGGAGVIQSFWTSLHMHVPSWVNILIFVSILGSVVWRGIHSVDKTNRLLMSAKIFVYIALILFISPHIHPEHIMTAHAGHLLLALPVVITSFGFASSIPTFCSYLEYDPKMIRKAILIGSSVTLVAYLIWNMSVQGSISSASLNAMAHGGNTTAALTQALSNIAKNPIISALAHVFTAICMLTAFMSVSLGLSDFLADGLKKKKSDNKAFVYAVTFVPPLLITLVYPKAFIAALSYAGIFCLILLVILPASMAWRGRYFHKIKKDYQVIGGKNLLLTVLGIATLLLVIVVINHIV